MFLTMLLLNNDNAMSRLPLHRRRMTNRSGRWQEALIARLFFLLIGFLTLMGSSPARADGPVILKNTVLVGLWQNSGYWAAGAKEPNFLLNSWFPQVSFRVRGPIAGGSQFIVEYTKPDGSVWGQTQCPTEEIGADRWTGVVTPRDSSTAAEKKYTTAVGTFGFKIRLKNELSGTNQVLYTGKFTVGKVSKSNGTPPTKNKYDYVVNHDWTLPLGYLWFDRDQVSTHFSATMWFKGDTNGADLSAYLFYKGKQIASTKEQGSASTTEKEVRTVDGAATDPAWRSWIITWFNIADTALDPKNPNERLFYLDKNPGEYEIKVLRKGTLCRTATFTVGADGKIVVPGVTQGADPMITTDRIPIPVKVLGTTDGVWNKAAWPNDAFYGNPIKGVTATL
jgi:hypothetical protein